MPLRLLSRYAFAKECLQAAFIAKRSKSTLKSIDKLQDAGDLSDLAKCLGYHPSALSYILYKIPNPDKYTTFKVPKKSGGERGN